MVKKLADANFLKTLDYCMKNSKFYKKHYRNIDLSTIKGVEDISKLPFTTKDDIADFTDEFLCVDEKSIVEIATTSGSTGHPLMLKYTKKDLERLALNEHLAFKNAGITESDTVLISVTIDKCFIAGLAYYIGLNSVGAASVRVGPKSPEMLFKMAEVTKPTAIIGVPTYLDKVYDIAAAEGNEGVFKTVKKLICIGEPVKEKDLSLNAIGKRLSQKYNAGIFSTYGITELAISFCECVMSKGGHIHPELIHVEIVDDEGNAVPDGVEGEVVATTFNVEGIPLIRFKTGDISFIIDEPECGCGLKCKRLGPVTGRKKQKLKIKGTSVYPQMIINVMESIEYIDNFVLIATSDTTLSDHIEVRCSLRPGIKDKSGEISAKLRGSLKVTPMVIIDSNTNIDLIQSSVSKRKKTKFVDRR
ncbi:MAG TPA: AMP-binding protein [bacterium]|nr:AMP-binding protein [bacterium]HPS30222.1 AMP-binding protein [bacterium]